MSSVARQKLQPYEKLLKSFEYGKSLDEVLKTKNPNTIHVLLDELHHRRGLEMALSNRNEDELLPILTFILQKINDPRYSNLLITILEIILDFYGNSIDSSLVVGNVVQKIVRKVGEEIRVQRAVGEVLGVVESMFIANETHNSSAPKMEMQLISK